MKRAFQIIIAAIILFCAWRFFSSVGYYAKLNTVRVKEQMAAVRELESSLHVRNAELDAVFEKKGLTDLDVVIREFKKECLNFKMRNRSSVHYNGFVDKKEMQPSGSFKVIMDCLADCEDPGVVRALNSLIKTGRDSEPFWAAKVAARRQELSCFDSILERLTAPRGTYVDLREKLCRVSSEFPREYTGPLITEKLKSDNHIVREGALIALVHCPYEGALPILYAALDACSMAERESVVQALIAMEDTAVPELIKVAGGKRCNARDAAIIALSRIPDEKALKAAFAESILDDLVRRNRAIYKSVSDCRRMVLDKGGKYRKEELEQAERLMDSMFSLFSKELNSPDEKVRLAAVELMGKIPRDEVYLCINRVLETEKSDKVRTAAMRCYKFSKDPAALELAWKNVLSHDGRLRGEAASIIVRNYSTAMIDRLKQLLEHSNPDVRCSAVWIVGRSRSAHKKELLLSKINDSEIKVVRKVCYELEKIEGQAGDISWLKNLHDHNKDRYVRLKISNMLGKLDTYEARTLLIKMLNAEDPGDAYDYLSKSEDERVFWPLVEFYVKHESVRDRKSGPPAVRAMAEAHWQELMPMLDSKERKRKILVASLFDNMKIPEVRAALRKRIMANDTTVMEFGSESFVKGNDREMIEKFKGFLKEDEDMGRIVAFRYFDTNTELKTMSRKWLTDRGFRIIEYSIPVSTWK